MTAHKPSPLVPKLRFPEFQDAGEWEEKKIGDLSEVKASGDIDLTYFSKLRSTTHLYPVYSNAVENAGIYGYYSLPRYKKNSVTITARGTLGVAFLRNHEFMGIGRLIVVSDLRNLNPCFLKECWNHLAVVPREVTSIPQLTAIAVRATVLPIPLPAEQHKIADCLGSLDDLIAAEGRKLEALRKHKQGLMQQLFPQPGETVPRLRFPEFQDAPDWKTGRCRDIAKVLPGYGFPNKFQGNKKGQYPFYKVSDISHTIEKGQRYISDANNYIDTEVLARIRGKSVPAGTIIFAKIGEAIRSNRRVITTKPAVIDNNTAGVKAMKARSSDEFLFYLWSNVSLIDHAGGVVPAVSKSALENVPLCYPSDPAEQQRIADCIGSLDDLIAADGRRLEALQRHKQGLMQQLFPSPEGH